MSVDPNVFDLDDFSFPLGSGSSPPPPPPPPPPTGGTMRQATYGEWRFWPQREDCTLRVLAPLGSYTDYTLTATVGGTKFRAVNWKEAAASGGVYTAADQVVLIPTENLPDGVAPKAGDLIVRTADADTPSLTVLEVTVGKFGNTHRCVTRDFALVASLRSTGTLYRPANTTDAAGKRVPGLAALASDVPCRVQGMTGTTRTAFDGELIAGKSTAYLGQRLIPKLGDVFAVDSGDGTETRYTVKGWDAPDRIDQLMTLDLEDLSEQDNTVDT